MFKRISVFVFLLIFVAVGADVLIINGLTHAFNTSAGQVLSGEIQLQNNGSESARVRFYITDYFFYYTGSTQYPEAGSLERSNADWIELQAPEITIPANSSLNYSFSVIVPTDESLYGTFWGVIMVEPVTEFLEETSEGITMRTLARYAVQIVTNLGNPDNKSIVIIGRSLEKEDDLYSLALDIENTGDWWLRPQVSARVFDSTGVTIGEFSGNSLRLYPGTSGHFRVPFEGLAPGSYSVLALIRDGEDAWGAQYSMMIE